MNRQTTCEFDLAGHLFSKVEPTLVVGQEQHVAATAKSRKLAGVWL